MSIHVQQSIDDPIITFAFEGEMNQETVQEASAQLAEAIETLGLLYAIIDLRDTEMTQGEAVALLDGAGSPPLMSHPRVRLVFVGKPVPHDPTNPSQAPVFGNDEEALEYIRQEIANNAP